MSPTNHEWDPDVHVYATRTGLIVQVDLTGLNGRDARMTVEGNLLTVHHCTDDGILCEIELECPPDTDPSRATAKARNNVLHIELPRRKVSRNTDLANRISHLLRNLTPPMRELENAPFGHFSLN